jgi:MFS family permease
MLLLLPLNTPSYLESSTVSVKMTEEVDAEWEGYEWVALSVTTVGALLASIQGSALLIALPEIMTHLQTSFLTIMWVILSFMLITTAVVPVVGRLADMFGRKNLYNAGFAVFTLGSLLAGLSQPQYHGWTWYCTAWSRG